MWKTSHHSCGAHYGLMDKHGDDVMSSVLYHSPPANLRQDLQENSTHYPDLERPQFAQLPVLTTAILMYPLRLESEVSYLDTEGRCEASTWAPAGITSGSTSLTLYSCFRMFKPGIMFQMPFLQSVFNRVQRITTAGCLSSSPSSTTTTREKLASLS